MTDYQEIATSWPVTRGCLECRPGGHCLDRYERGAVPAYSLGRLTLGIMGVGALLIVGFAVLMTRFTIRPITTLSRVAARAEAGDLTVRVSPTGGRRCMSSAPLSME